MWFNTWSTHHSALNKAPVGLAPRVMVITMNIIVGV
jgi:hypothetical protein